MTHLSDSIIDTEDGPLYLEDWLEDDGNFSRYTTDGGQCGYYGDSIWVCNNCECIEDECECGEQRD